MQRRIIFPEQGMVSFECFDLPEPGPTQVKVRTRYSLMSIGTETTILNKRYAPDTHFARMFSFPQLKTGVQAVGEVEAAGADVREFKPGDIVFMREAHGSHQVVLASECSSVPVAVDLKSACWCGLAKTAFRAAWAGRFELGEHVLIIGAGPLGQMAVRWAAAAGVETIAVVDLSEGRLQYAVGGGATHTYKEDISACLDEVAKIDDGRGPSIVVDVTGNAFVFKYTLKAASTYGKVILLGDSGYPSKQCLSSEFMTKGLTIQAVHDHHDRGGWTQRRIDELFFHLIGKGKFDLTGLITHEFPPEDCAAAYALANEQREEAIGILFDWSRADG